MRGDAASEEVEATRCLPEVDLGGLQLFVSPKELVTTRMDSLRAVDVLDRRRHLAARGSRSVTRGTGTR